jgi:hypothetical protein
MQILLSSTFLLATCSLVAAELRSLIDLDPAVRAKFVGDNVLKEDCDLALQAIGRNGTGIQSRCKASPITMDKLEPWSSADWCLNDGLNATCPSTRVFTKMDGPTKITVSKEQNGDINNIQVVDPACGSEVFEVVSPDLVASIPLEAYDEAEMANFVLLDKAVGATVRRNLRDARTPTDTAAQQAERDLQSCPSKSIKLAMVFDSSYCQMKGGYDNAVAAIETTVANVAALYEASTCLTVTLGYIEGWCNPDLDPYKDGVDTNKSGCGDEGLLDFFEDYWNANRQNVDRDLAHFASGTGLECFSNGSCVIGCAYTNVMCSVPTRSYGVNFLTFTSNQALVNSLLAHEIGHNAGSPHDNDPNNEFKYIMEPSVNDGSSGFSAQSQSEFNSQPQFCLDDVTAPSPPTASPVTPAPVPLPTASPVTPAPVPLPTCPETDVKLSILTDRYPGETRWTIVDWLSDVTVGEGGPYNQRFTMFTEEMCIPKGCYVFTITDSYGDGICCGFGAGNYSLEVDGVPLISDGGEFVRTANTLFGNCLPGGSASATASAATDKDGPGEKGKDKAATSQSKGKEGKKGKAGK